MFLLRRPHDAQPEAGSSQGKDGRRGPDVPQVDAAHALPTPAVIRAAAGDCWARGVSVLRHDMIVCEQLLARIACRMTDDAHGVVPLIPSSPQSLYQLLPCVTDHRVNCRGLRSRKDLATQQQQVRVRHPTKA